MCVCSTCKAWRNLLDVTQRLLFYGLQTSSVLMRTDYYSLLAIWEKILKKWTYILGFLIELIEKPTFEMSIFLNKSKHSLLQFYH